MLVILGRYVLAHCRRQRQLRAFAKRHCEDVALHREKGTSSPCAAGWGDVRVARVALLAGFLVLGGRLVSLCRQGQSSTWCCPACWAAMGARELEGPSGGEVRPITSVHPCLLNGANDFVSRSDFAAHVASAPWLSVFPAPSISGVSTEGAFHHHNLLLMGSRRWPTAPPKCRPHKHKRTS